MVTYAIWEMRSVWQKREEQWDRERKMEMVVTCIYSVYWVVHKDKKRPALVGLMTRALAWALQTPSSLSPARSRILSNTYNAHLAAQCSASNFSLELSGK